MRYSRAFFPLLLALILLFAQQVGVMHALSHTLAQKQDQQDKQSSHNPAACGQCAAYTQLGSALNSAIWFLLVMAGIASTVVGSTITFRSTQPLAVVARGPPAFLQAFI